MKNLESHAFDAVKCRQELNEYENLLKSKIELSERDDVLPFFSQRIDLSLFICSYFPKFSHPDVYAHEYGIGGDFVADLLVGDSRSHSYLLVEFEEGRSDGIFRRKGRKATREWAPRFEGAYSQLVDWMWKLDDTRSTSSFSTTFGSRHASFHGLIVVGKDMNLTPTEEDRLKWRTEKMMINSNFVSVVTFEGLLEDLDFRLRTVYGE